MIVRRFAPFNLKRIRQEAGFSRMDTALGLGVHADTVRNWERGQAPSRNSLVAIADFFGCDLNELFEEEAPDA